MSELWSAAQLAVSINRDLRSAGIDAAGDVVGAVEAQVAADGERCGADRHVHITKQRRHHDSLAAERDPAVAVQRPVVRIDQHHAAGHGERRSVSDAQGIGGVIQQQRVDGQR